jgi:alpha-aminoadipate carrier protein LysW
MRVAKCPECGAPVRVPNSVEVGDQVTCRSCGEELEVIDTDPLTLDYLSDFDEFDEEEEEEEFEDEFDEDEDWDEFDEDEDEDTF